MLNIVKILAIGILFAALGHLCAGCDSGDESNVALDSGPGLTYGKPEPGTDAGFISCSVPSSQPSNTVYFILVANDVRSMCETFKSQYSKATNCEAQDVTNCTVQPGYGNQILSTVPTAGIDCSDAAHDYRGTTGVPWGIWFLALDGKSPCNATFTGVPACLAMGMGVLPYTSTSHGLVPEKNYGICSSGGVFQGWTIGLGPSG